MGQCFLAALPQACLKPAGSLPGANSPTYSVTPIQFLALPALLQADLISQPLYPPMLPLIWTEIPISVLVLGRFQAVILFAISPFKNKTSRIFLKLQLTIQKELDLITLPPKKKKEKQLKLYSFLF